MYVSLSTLLHSLRLSDNSAMSRNPSGSLKMRMTMRMIFLTPPRFSSLARSLARWITLPAKPLLRQLPSWLTMRCHKIWEMGEYKITNIFLKIKFHTLYFISSCVFNFTLNILVLQITNYWVSNFHHWPLRLVLAPLESRKIRNARCFTVPNPDSEHALICGCANHAPSLRRHARNVRSKFKLVSQQCDIGISY